MILANAASGRGRSGRGAEVVARVVSELRRAGHAVAQLSVAEVRERREALSESLVNADVLVIAGGDGTVHHALGSCVAAGVPVYHLPLGTENLFARHFGMTCEPGMVVASIADLEHCVQRVDVVNAQFAGQTRMFGIMASIGPDASVVARLASVRRGGISHLSYVAPVVAEMMGAYLPSINVVVDGKQIVRRECGMLIVANSPEYALGVNPARGASMRDGVLDIVFMPATSAVGAGLWLARCAARMQFEGDSRCEGCLVASGRSVSVEFCERGEKKMMQLDGECVLVEGGNVVGFEVLAGALRVL